MSSTVPSLETLKQATIIAEKIQALQAELESLLAGGETVKRRGRPAKAKTETVESEAAPKKRTISEEGRQRIIAAQKKRWAAKKKARGSSLKHQAL